MTKAKTLAGKNLTFKKVFRRFDDELEDLEDIDICKYFFTYLDTLFYLDLIDYDIYNRMIFEFEDREWYRHFDN